MKYDLLKPFGFFFLVLFTKCQSILSDGPPVQQGTQLFLNRFSDDIENQNAVCNDGSKGAYYFSPASLAEAKDTFVIHLPGGGQCYDEDSCNERWKFKPTSMSSTNFLPVRYKKGFMDSSMKKTPFWSANKVMLGYCSSDGYMGDVGASKNSWGWHFRGQELVFAMIRDLILNHGLSSSSTIVFSGGSAGARGVMVLIDVLVADYFPKGAKVVGFLDSPYYVDVPSYSPLYKGFQYEESMKFKHMNTKNIISPECAASYPDASDLWKCQFGQYRMPFVKTSYLLITSQYDSYQLEMDTQTAPPYTKSASDYVTKFGSTIHNNLISLRDQKLKESESSNGASAVYAFYSWTCYNHDVSASSEFDTTAVDEGVTQKDALVAFLKASLVAYSSTKGVVGSESAYNGGSSNSVGSKASKGKKEKALASVEGKGKLSGPETAMENHERVSVEKVMREESSGSNSGSSGSVIASKKVVVRQTTVHSWVDSCVGINCGTSCPIPSPSTAGKGKGGGGGGYDIQSMGGAADNAVKKNKMLSQYNAESDSEEDSDQSVPFKSSPSLASKVTAAVSAGQKIVQKPISASLKLIIDELKDIESLEGKEKEKEKEREKALHCSNVPPPTAAVAAAALVAAGLPHVTFTASVVEGPAILTPPVPILTAAVAVAPVIEPFAVSLYMQYPLPIPLPLPLLPSSLQVQA